MLLMSWPMWVDGGEIPRVPFIRGLPGPPGRGSWVIFGAILGSIACVLAGFAWRGMVAASVGLLAFEVARDQNRFQPWIFLYAVTGLALAGTSRARGMRLARFYVISLYFYSGLSKLDVSFVDEAGSLFLDSVLGQVGLNASGWAEWAKVVAVLMMPGWELAIAGGLLARSTRRLATVWAIIQHVALLLILGPGGLNHSTIVLAWNVSMIVQDGLLFWPEPEDVEPATWRSRGIELGFAVLSIAPIFERFGLYDSWPAQALYASHCERTEIWIHEDDVEEFPPGIARRLGPSRPDLWRRLDLTGWSRDVRGTPIYPQGRVGNALAEHLAAKLGGSHLIRVVQWGRANPWTGIRDRVEAVGLASIQRLGDRWWVNPHPEDR